MNVQNMALTTADCEIWKFTQKKNWNITHGWIRPLLRNCSVWWSEWSDLSKTCLLCPSVLCVCPLQRCAENICPLCSHVR